MKKLLVVLCSAVIAMFALAGCGGYTAEDAKDLVEGSLQVDFYGEVTDEFVDSVVNEKDDLVDDYESSVEELAAIFAETSGIEAPTDEELNEYRELSKELMAKAKWEIGEVEEQENGSFIVPVKMYPVDVVDKIVNQFEDDFMPQAEGVDVNLSDEEYEAQLMAIAAEIIKGYIKDVDYLDPIELEVEVKEQKSDDDETYFMVDDSDYEDLCAAFFSF
ncbi:MAG: hypothetical protein U0M15_09315 [Bacillota bacterium]|nr:hypothetical protein [Bacillota bacterium]